MENQTARQVRVYLIEDEVLFRECLRTLLELEPGITVVGDAGEAGQALGEIGAHDAAPGVDVVLMDIQLPGMNGIEAIRALKEKYPSLNIVALTSHQGKYLEAAIEAGATGYILKSGNRQQLVQAVLAAHEGQTLIDPSLTSGLLRRLSELRRASEGPFLTPRQIEILTLTAQGARYEEIAARLFVSQSTVNREIRNIFNRLGAANAAQAVAEAYRRGLL